MSVHCYFQISPFTFSRIKVWALAGPLTQSYSFVMEAMCLGLLSCWKMNLLLSLRSRPLWLSSGMALYVDTFIFPSTSLPVPAAQRDAATTMLHCRDGIGQLISSGFPPDMVLGIQTKEFDLYFIRPDNFFSHNPSDAFWKLYAGCNVPFTEEWLLSGLDGSHFARWDFQ